MMKSSLSSCNSGKIRVSGLSTIKNNLPSNSFTCLGGIGAQQLKSTAYGLLDFDGIRIGLEDNLYYKGKEKTTNMMLLKRAHRIMNELDMKHYTSEELKEKGYGNKVTNIR